MKSNSSKDKRGRQYSTVTWLFKMENKKIKKYNKRER